MPGRHSLAALLALAALAVPATATAYDREAMVDTMLRNLNAKRSERGLAKLRAAPALLRSSQRLSHRLMENDTFAHPPLGRAGRLKVAGEALEMHSGGNARPRYALRRLLSSPVHNAILLGSSMRYVGMGVTRGRFYGSRAVIWVVRVARH